MRRALATVATVAMLAASTGACGQAGPRPAGGGNGVSEAAPPSTTSITTAAGAAGAVPTAGTTASPAPAPRTSTTPARVTAAAPVATPTTVPATTAPPVAPVTEAFESSVREVDEGVAARMNASWRPGCPVGLDDLRLVTVTHWGYDARVRTGEVVVRARYATALVGVFERLFRARFPIAQMRLVDEFGADDDRSMAANNTSAFNCRTVAGSTRWSEHAYGGAIDINPIQNPYVTPSGVSPPEGAPFASRNQAAVGLITRDGPVVAAFAAIGWGWGGSWSGGRDYQHFSAGGR